VNTRLQQTRWLSACMACAVGFALGGMLVVQVRTEVQRARYELGELDARSRALQVEVEQLRRQVTTLASPARIEALALELGMQKQPADAWFEVEPLLASAPTPSVEATDPSPEASTP